MYMFWWILSIHIKHLNYNYNAMFSEYIFNILVKSFNKMYFNCMNLFVRSMIDGDRGPPMAIIWMGSPRNDSCPFGTVNEDEAAKWRRQILKEVPSWGMVTFQLLSAFKEKPAISK